MGIVYNDLDKQILAAFATQNDLYRNAMDDDGMADTIRRAKLYDILSVATPTQFTQIWDRMVKGENFDKLVEELGRVQTEWEAMRREAI